MNREFNTIIIGGGIVGSGIFRDLSIHQVSTLIIDKKDFSSETSQNSSKMLHGGIRYLENMDFKLVYEALHEKNLWLKIAPHLCFEERFYLPVFNNSKRPLWMIRIGLFLYDLLSGFKNTLHSSKSVTETLKTIPFLKSEGLAGCGIYSDAIVDDAKMTIEMILDGLYHNKKSAALNYHEFVEDIIQDDFHVVKIKNTLTNIISEIKCKNIIYAVGPFTDQLLLKNKNFNWSEVLIPSKGSHLWFLKKDIPLSNPIVMTDNNNRVIFVIPQNDLVLVGTTEEPITDEISNLKISKKETDYLLTMLGEYFPNLNLNYSNIQGSFSGIRPLVKEDLSNNLGKVSREHKIFQPLHSVFVIAGGKYTTFRVMGQEITRNIILKLGKNYNEDLTKQKLNVPSTFSSFQFHLPSEQEIKKIFENEMPKTFEDFVIRRLGINSKRIWNSKTNISFDSYFTEYFSLMSHYITIHSDDIKNFREN